MRKVKLLEFPNGFYQGLITENNKRDGQGIFYWDSGQVFLGKK